MFDQLYLGFRITPQLSYSIKSNKRLRLISLSIKGEAPDVSDETTW